MVQCPSCARLQEPRLICQQCGAPLAVEIDYFAVLGIPRKVTIDASELERAYHDLGRKIHPDRFATAAAPLRDASLRATALLTRSYRTLADPIARGRYWLELNDEKLGQNNQQVPPEMAAMVFEVQEQLAEIRASRGGPELRGEVEKRRGELGAAMERLMADLGRNFARWDADAGDREQLVGELKNVLSRIAYLRTLMRDVDRELQNLKVA